MSRKVDKDIVHKACYNTENLLNCKICTSWSYPEMPVPIRHQKCRCRFGTGTSLVPVPVPIWRCRCRCRCRSDSNRHLRCRCRCRFEGAGAGAGAGHVSTGTRGAGAGAGWIGTWGAGAGAESAPGIPGVGFWGVGCYAPNPSPRTPRTHTHTLIFWDHFFSNHPLGEITFFSVILLTKSLKVSSQFLSPFLYKISHWEKFLRYISLAFFLNRAKITQKQSSFFRDIFLSMLIITHPSFLVIFFFKLTLKVIFWKKSLQKAGKAEGVFTTADGVKPPPPAIWVHSFFETI